MAYGIDGCGGWLQVCDRGHDPITFVAKHASDCPVCERDGRIEELEAESATANANLAEAEARIIDMAKENESLRDENTILKDETNGQTC